MDRPPENVRQVDNQAARDPRGRFADHVDEQVDIAVVSLLPASHRTEKMHVTSAVARRDAADFFAMLSDLPWQTHS